MGIQSGRAHPPHYRVHPESEREGSQGHMEAFGTKVEKVSGAGIDPLTNRHVEPFFGTFKPICTSNRVVSLDGQKGMDPTDTYVDSPEVRSAKKNLQHLVFPPGPPRQY